MRSEEERRALDAYRKANKSGVPASQLYAAFRQALDAGYDTPQAVRITLREHYAGLAMAALLSRQDGYLSDANGAALPRIAHFAVLHADALIARLAEKPEAPK